MTDQGMSRTFHEKPLTAAERLAIRSLSFDVRKAMVDDMHVGYPGFRAATAFVRKRHWPVEKATTHGVGKFHALFGEWRTGKSRVVEHYATAVNAARERKDKTPIVHVECGSGWGAKQVFLGILRKLTGSAPSASNSLDNLCDLTVNVMQALGVELLVLDDMGEVLSHRGGQHAGPLLSHLKIILDRRFCNILGIGPSTLFPLLRTTFGYIGGRGGLMHHEMPTLDWHGRDDCESYMMLLDDMDSLLPFPKKSGLGIPRYAAHFYDLSAGSIGYTASYVAAAAMLALDEDADRIEHRHLVEMAVSGRDPADRFTHFADELDPKLVGWREVRK